MTLRVEPDSPDSESQATTIIHAPVPSETHAEYAVRFGELRSRYASINFVPTDDQSLQQGLASWKELSARSQAGIQKLANNQNLDVVPKLSKYTLHKAMDAYIDSIKTNYIDPEDKTVSDNGKTKIRQVQTLKCHLKDMPLSDANHKACETMFRTFQNRPSTHRTAGYRQHASRRQVIRVLYM